MKEYTLTVPLGDLPTATIRGLVLSGAIGLGALAARSIVPAYWPELMTANLSAFGSVAYALGGWWWLGYVIERREALDKLQAEPRITGMGEYSIVKSYQKVIAINPQPEPTDGKTYPYMLDVRPFETAGIDEWQLYVFAWRIKYQNYHPTYANFTQRIPQVFTRGKFDKFVNIMLKKRYMVKDNPNDTRASACLTHSGVLFLERVIKFNPSPNPLFMEKIEPYALHSMT